MTTEEIPWHKVVKYERPPVQWWPFRPRYLRRIYQYKAFTTGRCSPMVLVKDTDGTRFAADVLRPARHADDTWTVRADEPGNRIYEIETKQILDVDCARVQAGYEC
ncbi:hypothetical protein [uncultured Roseobacter sp.]|uniref:hypothetical protein n=1 Tax=uncultured Roseobacter sp. TaxID=114847 RepID=UPI002638439D|nr:hypothetical protein [uncultured Roseobacter sp.]